MEKIEVWIATFDSQPAFVQAAVTSAALCRLPGYADLEYLFDLN